MLVKRIITAVIGIGTAAYIINIGGYGFSLILMLLMFVAWHEFVKMLSQRQIGVDIYSGFLATGLFVFCLERGIEQTVAIWLLFFYVLSKMLYNWQRDNSALLSTVFTLFGLLYIIFSFSHLVLLRQLQPAIAVLTVVGEMSLGTFFLWLALIATWASDTFAFFVGSAVGCHKLAPAISPNKSIEGLVGGLCGAMLAAWLCGWAANVSPITCLIAGALVGVAAPLGDLVESALKRFCGVKDSGNVLPGHGGVLDRFDSVLFSVPIVYYYVIMFVVS